MNLIRQGPALPDLPYSKATGINPCVVDIAELSVIDLAFASPGYRQKLI